MRSFFGAALALVAPALQAASISGQVVNAVTGGPVRKAQVVLRRGDNPSQPYGAATDAAGHFSVAGVEPGTYRLGAERAGYVRTEYGARRPNRPGTPFEVSEGQDQAGVVLRLWPQGVITGRVIDDDGDPVATAGVQLVRFYYARGQRRVAVSMSSFTNDLGEFRLYGLAAGRYYLRIEHRASTPVVRADAGSSTAALQYVPVYYPNATDIGSATPIRVAPGSQVEGLQVRLARAPTVQVSGRVTGAGGRAVVTLYAPDEYGVPGRARNTLVRGADGAFEISGVLPGNYVAVAVAQGPGRHRRMAAVPVPVGQADVDGVALDLAESVDLPGRVQVEGDAPLKLDSLRLNAAPRVPWGYPATALVQADGSFLLAGLDPLDYSVEVTGAPGNYYVKSMRMGQQDALAGGLKGALAASQTLEVVLSPAGGQITGQAFTTRNEPAPGATVVLVPDQHEIWRRYSSTSADEHGRFELHGITPGDYHLYAFDDVPAGAWEDPDFLKAVESWGSTLSVHEGGSGDVQVREVPDEAIPDE